MNAEPVRYCTHMICRCTTAEELIWMANKTGRDDLFVLALDAHFSTVRCRLGERKGPVRATVERTAA